VVDARPEVLVEMVSGDLAASRGRIGWGATVVRWYLVEQATA
jgi:hypothetical protein